MSEVSGGGSVMGGDFGVTRAKFGAGCAVPCIYMRKMNVSVSDIIEGLLLDAEAALATGATAKALAIYRGVLSQNPDHVLALRQAGAIMLHQNNALAAVELFQRAVRLAPTDADLFHGVGTALRLLGHHDDALQALEAGLKIDPTHAPALHDVALIYRQRGDLARAEALFRAAAAYGGGQERFEAELQRAIALFKQDRLPEAERWFHRAGLLNPNDPRPFINVAMIYRTWGHVDAAVTWLEKAIGVAPDSPDAHWNLANALLVRGDLKRGFEEYEWRFRRAGRTERAFDVPRWRGEDLTGKTLVLSAEQGLGDVIQYARFAKAFAARGAAVVLECHAGLEQLLSTIPGVQAVATLGHTLPPADYYLPIMSAPFALGFSQIEQLSAAPYIRAPKREREVVLPQGQVRVGVVWRGNPRHENDHFRSVSLQTLQPILDVEGATFVSLQVGDARRELEGFQIFDAGKDCADFADTAHVVAQLNVVVTVDTAVAHLAGAMGKPVWLLLARGNDWRWFHGAADTPWYANMQLYRQAPHREWGPPVRQIAAALRKMIG
jgi:Flp pilus assembly protein TadD